jgi:hypothetical protein
LTARPARPEVDDEREREHVIPTSMDAADGKNRAASRDVRAADLGVRVPPVAQRGELAQGSPAWVEGVMKPVAPRS